MHAELLTQKKYTWEDFKFAALTLYFVCIFFKIVFALRFGEQYVLLLLGTFSKVLIFFFFWEQILRFIYFHFFHIVGSYHTYHVYSIITYLYFNFSFQYFVIYNFFLNWLLFIISTFFFLSCTIYFCMMRIIGRRVLITNSI